jgi:hypothetical protein
MSFEETSVMIIDTIEYQAMKRRLEDQDKMLLEYQIAIKDYQDRISNYIQSEIRYIQDLCDSID